nr:hypothetical protein [Neobacillus terrae]
MNGPISFDGLERKQLILIETKELLEITGSRFYFPADIVILQDGHDIQSEVGAQETKRGLVLIEFSFPRHQDLRVFHIRNGTFVFVYPELSFTLHGHRAKVGVPDVWACEFGHGYLDSIRTDLPVRFDGANHMKTFGITGINQFLACIPAVHQDIDLFLIIGWKCLDLFHSQVFLTFEG